MLLSSVEQVVWMRLRQLWQLLQLLHVLNLLQLLHVQGLLMHL